jgi:hypothetical protein
MMSRKILSLLVTVFLIVPSLKSQELDSAVARKAVETKNYIFKARTATPQRGGFRQLTSEYDFVVKPDTIVSYLPYYGRSFSAPINPSDAGLQFTSKNYEYSVKNKKKNRWEIIIKPKDVTRIRDLNLTVFDNGRASLRVNSNDREAITFDGYLKVDQ